MDNKNSWSSCSKSWQWTFKYSKKRFTLSTNTYFCKNVCVCVFVCFQEDFIETVIMILCYPLRVGCRWGEKIEISWFCKQKWRTPRAKTWCLNIMFKSRSEKLTIQRGLYRDLQAITKYLFIFLCLSFI